MKPYEPDAGRILALYRMAAGSNPVRTLELCTKDQLRVLSGDQIGGDRWITCTVDGEADSARMSTVAAGPTGRPTFGPWLSFPDESFELVVMHGTLDALAAAAARRGNPFSVTNVLAEVRRVLVPGGVVAGSASSKCSLLHALRCVVSRKEELDALLASDSTETLRATLRKAGYIDVRLYCLLPHARSPMKLVEMNRRVARHGFKRELEAGRGQLGFGGYWLRQVILMLDLYPIVHKSLFFYGRKPC